MVPSTKQPKKFSKILLPYGNRNFFDAELYNQNIFLAPTSFLIATSSVQDLCQIKHQVKELQPELWNNSKITNPCEQYFCSNSTPHFFSINQNETIPLEQRIEAQNTHIAINRLCSLCESNLTLNFNNFIKNNTCKWFDRTCDSDYCTDRSVCIPYKKEYNLCYLPQRDLFMAKDDFTHDPYLNFIASLIFFIADIIFLIIPQSVYLTKYMLGDHERNKKIRLLFNLKNFIRIIVCTLHLIPMVASFIDTMNLISVRLYVMANIYCASASLIAFNLMIVEWSHVLTELESLHAMTISWKNLLLLLFTIVPLSALTGFNLLSYILYTFVDGQKRGFFKYLIGVIFLLMIFLLITEVLGSSIASIKVIFKVYSNKVMQQDSSPLDIIRLSFTKYMIFLIGNSIHCTLLMFFNAIIFLVGNDALSIQLYCLQAPLISTSNLFMSSALFYGVLPKDHIKKYYCCCCNKED
eukprot:gene3357-5904_t